MSRLSLLFRLGLRCRCPAALSGTCPAEAFGTLWLGRPLTAASPRSSSSFRQPQQLKTSRLQLQLKKLKAFQLVVVVVVAAVLYFSVFD